MSANVLLKLLHELGEKRSNMSLAEHLITFSQLNKFNYTEA